MHEFKSHATAPVSTRLTGARKAPRPIDREKLERAAQAREQERPVEVGGPEGPEPTRYGDWERKGICVDF